MRLVREWRSCPSNGASSETDCEAIGGLVEKKIAERRVKPAGRFTIVERQS
jgi:hypothetical protein